MMTPEDMTVHTYQHKFDLYRDKTAHVMSGEFIALMDAFSVLLPKAGRVFELGSAHGRDARYLRDKGYTVMCADIIPQALVPLQAEGFETHLYDFRDEVKAEWVNAFDGVLAKAVFLHATQKVFEASLVKIGSCVKEGGVLCLTFKVGEGEEIETAKLRSERYFKYYTPKDLALIIAKYAQFELIDSTETSDGKWIQVLLRRVG